MDKSDRNLLLFLVFGGAGFIVIVSWIAMDMLPIAIQWVNTTFGEGLSFKYSAAISFVLTTLLMGFLAYISDGGILGEVQYLLGSFFFFFIVITLLVAWIF